MRGFPNSLFALLSPLAPSGAGDGGPLPIDWLLGASNASIFLASAALPIVLAVFVRKMGLSHAGVFLLFGALLAMNGFVHLAGVSFFEPVKNLVRPVAMLTAASAWCAVFALVRIGPRALALPSMEDLQHEVDERSRLERESELKNRDLQTLLHVTSHDLREPLRAIRNFAQIVNKRYADDLDEKGRDYLRRVVRGGDRMDRLIEDVLLLSRSVRQTLKLAPLDGRRIVLEALEGLNERIAATSAVVKIEDDLPEVMADRTWAVQAVQNLVSNALKFTNPGEPPDVEIRAFEGPSHPSAVAGEVGFVVADRGPGIEPKNTDRIFELFQRGVGRDVEGSGAGLAIVQQVAERHGGRVWVQPRSGGGSEFVLTFGVQKLPPQEITEDELAAA